MRIIETVSDLPSGRRKRGRPYTTAELKIIRKMAPDYSAAEIARVLGTSTGAIHDACSYRRIKLNGYVNKRRRTLSARFGYGELIDIFKREAARRGIAVGTLGRRILETVARDGMFSAILDD